MRDLETGPLHVWKMPEKPELSLALILIGGGGWLAKCQLRFPQPKGPILMQACEEAALSSDGPGANPQHPASKPQIGPWTTS